MAFDSKEQQKLIKLLKGTPYRQVVSKRANVHANTVTNVLKEGTDNPTVELEIAAYAEEIKAEKAEQDAKRKKTREIMKQL